MKFRYRIILTISIVAVTFCLLCVSVVSGESQVLGFYSDGFGLFRMDDVPWGSVMAGYSVHKTVFVKNEAGAVLGSIVFSAQNFEPALAESSLSFSGSQVLDLEPNEVRPVTLTLSADSLNRGVEDFSFDIVATAYYSSDGGESGVLPEPSSVVVPFEETDRLSSGEMLVLLVVVGVGGFVLFGGGKRR